MSDWHTCTHCQHLGVQHAANGPCLAGVDCACVEFEAES